MANGSSLNRFTNFLDSQAGAECIDSLDLTPEQAGAEHADYFLQARHIVVEIKSLETDTAHKMQPILAPHMERPEFQEIPSRGLDAVLEMIHDGNQIRDAIFRAITESVEGVVEKANRQIRETKRTFDIPDAYGLLVVLNDAVLILPPTTVAKRVAHCFIKRTVTGDRRFPEIDAAWLLNERHLTQIGGRRAVADIIIQNSQNNRGKYTSAIADHLSEKWAAFNQKQFVRASQELIGHLRFRGKPKTDT